MKNQRDISILSCLIGSFFLIVTACKKNPPKDPAPSGEYAHGAWVVNEGTFGFANGSVDFYHKDKNENEKDIFAKTNGYPLGDVLQSISLYKDKYYLVVNNAHSIVVTDATNFKVTGTITGLNSPRYFLPINEHKAYVSDLYAKAIWIVDPAGLKISGSIPYQKDKGDNFSGWTEQMLQLGDKVYVGAMKTGQVLVLDINSDKIVDSINTGIKPQCIVKDKEDKLWVLCNANYEQKESKIQRIDPQTKQIIKTYTFPSVKDNPLHLVMNASGDSVLFLANGVCRMDIHAAGLPSPFIAAAGRNLYALAVDPEDGTLYVGNGADNVQTGEFYKYTPAGKLLGTYATGVSPTDFLFVKR